MSTGDDFKVAKMSLDQQSICICYSCCDNDYRCSQASQSSHQDGLLSEETWLIQTGCFTNFPISAGKVQSVQMNFYAFG